MFDEALELLASGDSLVAIEFLSRQDDPLAAAGVYNKLLKHLHYEEKDIQAVTNMGRAGIQHSLSAAEARFMAVKRKLSAEKDGRFFVEQLEAARRVFSS